LTELCSILSHQPIGVIRWIVIETDALAAFSTKPRDQFCASVVENSLDELS
jgi:hypothetical protein